MILVNTKRCSELKDRNEARDRQTERWEKVCVCVFFGGGGVGVACGLA